LWNEEAWDAYVHEVELKADALAEKLGKDTATK
jgi:DNA-binding transcriptional regulator/RsmH inhibitor MraZ